MAEYYSQNNSTIGGFGGDQNAGYDLNEEKEIITEITKEIKEDLLEKWKLAYIGAQIFPSAVVAMHPDVRDFLLEFARVTDYNDIARQANLNQDQRNVLPQIVWHLALSKNWGELPKMISENLAVNPAMTANIAQSLEQKIIGKLRVLAEKPFVQKTFNEPVKKDVSMPLKEALEKYPSLGEQQVTSNMLKLKYFSDPVRPSIKNWITDYHDNMGNGKHEVMDRGNFLFHSENGKRLTASERQKLTMVLRALDDNAQVQIDPEKQLMIFPNGEPTISNQPLAALSQTTGQEQSKKMNNPMQSFKPVAPPAQTFRATVSPTTGQNHQQLASPSPSRNEPVIDLKEKLTNSATRQSQQPAARPIAQQPNSFADDTQRDPRYFGSRSITNNQEEIKSTSTGFGSLKKTEIAVGGRTAQQQNDEAVESIFGKGVGIGSEKYFSNFSSNHSSSPYLEPIDEPQSPARGEVAFAAPQQFPAEMKASVPSTESNYEKTVEIRPQPTVSAAPEHAHVSRSHVPYLITPMEDKYMEDDSVPPKSTDPKINGNVVDLKN